MTTITKFNPTATTNFQFNPILDGTTYVAICTWNAYGQRYYISLYNNYGTLIMTRPIIGSPDNYNVNLLIGYFTTSTLVYRSSSQNFEVNP